MADFFISGSTPQDALDILRRKFVTDPGPNLTPPNPLKPNANVTDLSVTTLVRIDRALSGIPRTPAEDARLIAAREEIVRQLGAVNSFARTVSVRGAADAISGGATVPDSSAFPDGRVVNPAPPLTGDLGAARTDESTSNTFGFLDLGRLAERQKQIDLDRAQIQNATNEFLLAGGSAARGSLGGFIDLERDRLYQLAIEREIAYRQSIGVIGPNLENIGFGDRATAGLPGFFGGVIAGGVGSQKNIPIEPAIEVRPRPLGPIPSALTGAIPSGFVEIPQGPQKPANPMPIRPPDDPDEKPMPMRPPGAFPDDLFRRNPPDP